MMDELKRLIIEYAAYVKNKAEVYDGNGRHDAALMMWREYDGLDWVLDTIAELEINETADR